MLFIDCSWIDLSVVLDINDHLFSSIFSSRNAQYLYQNVDESRVIVEISHFSSIHFDYQIHWKKSKKKEVFRRFSHSMDRSFLRQHQHPREYSVRSLVFFLGLEDDIVVLLVEDLFDVETIGYLSLDYLLSLSAMKICLGDQFDLRRFRLKEQCIVWTSYRLDRLISTRFLYLHWPIVTQLIGWMLITQNSSMQKIQTPSTFNGNVSTRRNSKNKPKIAEDVEEKSVLVWLDRNANDENSSYRKCLNRLHKIFISSNTFVNSDDCLQFLNRTKTTKIWFLVNKTFLKDIWLKVRSITNIHSIFYLRTTNRKNIIGSKWRENQRRLSRHWSHFYMAGTGYTTVQTRYSPNEHYSIDIFH